MRWFAKVRAWIETRTAQQLGKSAPELERDDYFEWFAQSPGYAPLVTLSVAALGIIASIYPRMVQSSFGNIPFMSGDPFSWGATGFWLLFVLSVLLFWGRRAAENRADRRDREARRDLVREQEESVRRLREEFRSMPPSGFLNLYKTTFRGVQVARAKALEFIGKDPSYEAERAVLHSLVRTALIGVVDLCRRYDQEADDRYAANVMVYVPVEQIPEDHYNHLSDRLQHVEREVDINKLRGVLDFQADLSVVSLPDQNHAEAGRPTVSEDATDKEHPPVAFGIVSPQKSELESDIGGERLWRVGPGAPTSLLTEGPVMFKDVEEIRRWMKERSTLGPEVQRRTLTYVQNDALAQIGSFVSIPIPRSEGAAKSPLLDHDLPIGVLNIHRSGTRILNGQDKSLGYFDATIMSINQVLAESIQRLAFVEYEKCGRWQHMTH